MALDLKKKVGPLPVWGWGALALGGAGVWYFVFHKSSSSTNSTSQTDSDLAAQQAADSAQAGTPYYGADAGDDSGSALPDDVATGTTTTDQLDADLQTIQGELSALSTLAPTDSQTYPTIGQEASDLLAAQSALTSLAGGGTATGSGSGTAAAKAKSVAGLPVLTQLEDLAAGVTTKAGLGSGASAALAAAGGNVTAAIAARPAVATASTAPVTRTTTATPKATTVEKETGSTKAKFE